jgi:hypothetical protein
VVDYNALHKDIEGKPTAYWFVGEYDEDYVRVNGKWKFKSLKISQKFSTAHTEDWAIASLERK